jgi:hypothetical protein
MSIGKEYLRQLHEVLAAFEQAIKQRESPGVLGASVALQQDVDRARQRVVEIVVEIATKERMRT